MYISQIAYELGNPHDIYQLQDPKIDVARDQLLIDGFELVHISEEPSWRLAALAAKRSLPTPAPHIPLLIYSPGADWWSDDHLAKLHASLQLPGTVGMLVGGKRCANFGAGLEVGTALMHTEHLPAALYVTVHRAGTREPRVLSGGNILMSDGAAACLFTRQPIGPSFRIDGVVSVSNNKGALPDGLTRSAATIRGVRESTRLLSNRLHCDLSAFRLVVTANMGLRTLEVITKSLAASGLAIFPDKFNSVAHCSSADCLINLKRLTDQGALTLGDRLILLNNTYDTWYAIAVTFVEGSDG